MRTGIHANAWCLTLLDLGTYYRVLSLDNMCYQFWLSLHDEMDDCKHSFIYLFQGVVFFVVILLGQISVAIYAK